MPRQARTVFAHLPHHITKRGNQRENIFFTISDRQTYLSWLKDYCDRHKVEILAYCLMTNPVHLVAVPTTAKGLQDVLKLWHMRYAQRLNRQRGWTGHVWQGRFFSAPLDEPYMWAAIRYVERNPVRARLVRKAENYPWSSAAAHCHLKDDKVLTSKATWWKPFHQNGNWSEWLSEGDEPKDLTVLRRNSEKELPCGSDSFINRLEKKVGRLLQYRPLGRPKKQEGK